MTEPLTALRQKTLFVLDMDGTFYLGDRILDGSLDFIRTVRAQGRRFLFFTNNSSRISEFYAKKLAGMGCPVGERDVVTSGDVTVEFLRREYPGTPVYLLGTPLLRRSFEQAGIPLSDDNPALVVVGFDLTLCYERVSKACALIRGGAPFIATHPDLNCPTEGGFIPDCGAMCAMITASTGVCPRILGKPYPETLEAVTALTGVGKDRIVFVGDRLYTDIAIGADNGVATVLVLSGETAREDVAGSRVQPDYIFENLGALGRALAGH